jgi:predicted deacetylase
MNREHWQRFLPLINECGIRPILAVIPDNRDEQLMLSPPDPEFWNEMRAMELAGATIGLHGYRHLCLSEHGGLLPLHKSTEFAGVPEDLQRQWIREGLNILRSRGLHPTIFVAPRHGFDRATLRALCCEGIQILSDGFARVTFRRDGVTWIPQQLWGPFEKSKGLWTICIHPNSASAAEVDQLCDFVRAHSEQFTSVERVMSEFPPSNLRPMERIYEIGALGQVRASIVRKHWKLRFGKRITN